MFHVAMVYSATPTVALSLDLSFGALIAPKEISNSGPTGQVDAVMC